MNKFKVNSIIANRNASIVCRVTGIIKYEDYYSLVVIRPICYAGDIVNLPKESLERRYKTVPRLKAILLYED